MFASIQSLASAGLGSLDPQHFDVVIVDEFHHAAAPSYVTLLEHVQPIELLGLTATPERADGLDVLRYFDGRIAAELRVWDAIDQQYLVPFVYYGIHDGLDLRHVPWRRGQGYDVGALTNVYTANDVWVGQLVAQLRERVADVRTMRALGFCVSIEHARFMAREFERRGIPARAVWGTSSSDERRQALADLAEGAIAALFTVDLFNEGIDLPNVDTLLLLRPTESATLFLQQLGRGLRRAHGKSSAPCSTSSACTDASSDSTCGSGRCSAGPDRNCSGRSSATSRSSPPAATSSSIRSLATSCWRASATPSRRAGPSASPSCGRSATSALPRFLDETGLELDDVYANNRSWTELRRAAGLPTHPAGPDETALLRAVGRLLHVDDDERITRYRQLIVGRCSPVAIDELSERERRLLRMLLASIVTNTAVTTMRAAMDALWAHRQVRSELDELLDELDDRVDHVQPMLGAHADVPLHVHARYTRIEIQAAFNDGTALRPPRWDSGVKWLPDEQTDMFAFTLDKTSGDFSPTTRYQDYAISPELIHWESQSTTSLASPTGTALRQPASRQARACSCSLGCGPTIERSGASGRPRTSATTASGRSRSRGGSPIACRPTSTRPLPPLWRDVAGLR